MHTLIFTYEKATKNTHRYTECDEDGSPIEWGRRVIGSIYIRKHEVPSPPPTKLFVTVEVVPDDN